jgi:hypothetical protein
VQWVKNDFYLSSDGAILRLIDFDVGIIVFVDYQNVLWYFDKEGGCVEKDASIVKHLPKSKYPEYYV